MLYMRITTWTCDFWTFMLMTIVIAQLTMRIIRDRKDYFEHKKRKLYLTSIFYVLLIPM